MKSEELTNMSEADLRHTLEDSRQELFNLRFQIATRKIKNHQRIPHLKRDIARIMTVLRERELMAAFGGVDLEELETARTQPAAETTTRRRSLFGRGSK